MRMSETHYLPHEKLDTTNFPELLLVEKQLRALVEFGQRASVALANYETGKAEAIFLNLAELEVYIGICRSVCEILGKAPNVCYDILMELRAYQYAFYDILAAGKQYGSSIIRAK